MRDLKGLRHLARLLAEPGREFHVLDLVGAEEGTLPLAELPPPATAAGRLFSWCWAGPVTRSWYRESSSLTWWGVGGGVLLR